MKTKEQRAEVEALEKFDLIVKKENELRIAVRKFFNEGDDEAEDDARFQMLDPEENLDWYSMAAGFYAAHGFHADKCLRLAEKSSYPREQQ